MVSIRRLGTKRIGLMISAAVRKCRIREPSASAVVPNVPTHPPRRWVFDFRLRPEMYGPEGA